MGEPELTTGHCGSLEWAACATAFPGQRRSGDAFLVWAAGAGTLVALVDALGHGDDAADVASRALASLQETAERPLPESLASCHAALRGSRGAAVTLAMIDPVHRTVTWAGVGNVEMAVLRRGRGGGRLHRRSVTLRGGVVGDRLPPLRQSSEPIGDGDALIGASDGLSTDFLDSVDLSLPPAVLARRLHRSHAKDSDDALVFVAHLAPITGVRSRTAPYPYVSNPHCSFPRGNFHDPELRRPAQE